MGESRIIGGIDMKCKLDMYCQELKEKIEEILLENFYDLDKYIGIQNNQRNRQVIEQGINEYLKDLSGQSLINEKISFDVEAEGDSVVLKPLFNGEEITYDNFKDLLYDMNYIDKLELLMCIEPEIEE